MATIRSWRLRFLPLLLFGLLGAVVPGSAAAGPLIRRAQERRACQEFAGKLQQASGNPAMAQQVYQQGVLQLVQRFGENPCGDIPAPVAAGATPAAAGAAPAGVSPVTPAPGTPASTSPAAAASTTQPASTTAVPAAAAAPSAQQQQACQQFATKLQASAASGGAAAAQQTYAMGLEKLSGMFGPNPCPAVKAPQ